MNNNSGTPQAILGSDRLQSWSTLHTDPESIPGPIGRHAGHLCRSFGFGSPASLILSALFLTAVTGPSRRIFGGSGCTLPPTLNIVLVTKSPVTSRAAARLLFEPLISAIKKTMQTTGLNDRTWLLDAITQIRLALLQTQDIIEGIGPKPEVTISSGNSAKGTEFEARLERQAAAEKQVMLRSQLTRLERKLHPETIVEALDAAELLDADLLSFDAAVVNQSYAGETLRSLRNLTAQRLHEIARVLSASWRGLNAVGRDRSRGAQISNLWVTDQDSLAETLESEFVRESRVLDTFVFIETDSAEMKVESEALEDRASWWRMANYLVEARFNGGTEHHRLAASAAALFNEFLTEVNSEWPHLAPEARSFADCWPDLALKLSLLLHLGSHDPKPLQEDASGKPTLPEPPPTEIEAETVRTAIQLTKILVSQHLELTAGFCQSVSNGGDPEVERMLKKIRLKQPIARRDLYRSYPKQNRALLDPVLARAIALGRVREEGCFLYIDDHVSVCQRSQSVSVSSATDFKGSLPNDSNQEEAR